MRILHLLTSSTTLLLLLQQLISVWFAFDFFLARDSFTADSLLKRNSNYTLDQELHLLVNDVQAGHCQHVKETPPTFDKLVLVVVDALGSEFIPTIRTDSFNVRTPVSMPFVESAIRGGKALGLVAKAATPTVTMPRIKAMVSGTIPSFVDLMYNLASDVSKFEEENLLGLARARNKSIVFYGDDTWLSLFDRKMFSRAKETLSLFASDYTTVDTNVTEKALPETSRRPIDWDILILHYLGLDHIGHVFGSNSHLLIRDKLLEMDRIIKKIHDDMATHDHKTLVVVCGDHGMSQDGNHGGSTDLEVNTAVIFIPINHSIRFAERSRGSPIQQIDLASTLTTLLGMPIPNRSKGIVISRLLAALWNDKDDSRLFCTSIKNLIQLTSLIESSEFASSVERLKLIELLRQHKRLDKVQPGLADGYLNIANQLQVRLLQTIASSSNPIPTASALLLITFLTLISVRKIAIRLLLPMASKSEQLACLLIFITPIVMHGSTDFIEFEHVFWPVFTLTTLTLMVVIAARERRARLMDMDRFKVILFVLTFLVTSSLNNLRLFRDDSTISQYILPSIAVTILCNFIRQNSDIPKFRGASAVLVGATIMISKLIEDSENHAGLNTVIQRLTILVVIGHTAMNIASKSGNNTNGDPSNATSRLIAKLAAGWICVSFLLARRHNFLFLTCNIMMETGANSTAGRLGFPLVARVLLYLNLAQSAFYNQGNSNLFSTLDIRPAFFGQTEYSIILATPLVAIATYSAQIYWYLKLFQRVDELKTQSGHLVHQQTPTDNHRPTRGFVLSFVVGRNFLSLSYYLFVCLVLRNHLFIWSVISPKLIYHLVSNNVMLVAALVAANVQPLHARPSESKFKSQIN